MQNPLFAILLCVLCIISNVNAHIFLTSVTTNNLKQSTCIRATKSNSPISSITSPDMKCGFLPLGDTPAASKCPAAAGSTVGLQWNHESTAPTDDIIDASHRGPCLVYLSRDNGVSWFKVYEDGYNLTTSKFCVDKLIANKGYFEFKLPSDIAPGDYLMRGEIIALHEANRIGRAQPYVLCTELTITGSGTAKPAGVAFPGAYSETDPGIYFNIYANPIPAYPIPGPALYKQSASSDIVGTGGSSASTGGNSGNNENGGGSGLSPGGSAALALFIIAFVAIVVGSVLFVKLGYGTIDKKFPFYHRTTDTSSHYMAYTEKI